MKRFLCTLMVLCLIPVIAFAVDDIDVMVYGHNIYAALTGAQELTGEPNITKNDDNTVYIYSTGSVDVGFIVKESKVSTCFCRATEENAGEMLSQAASALYNICGTNNISYWYTNLLDQFFKARAGEKTETPPFIENVCMFTLRKENGVYTFLAAKLY